MTRNLLKKILITLVTFLFVLSIIPFSGVSKKASAKELKPIDVYLIGGQSNAAGYSPIIDKPTGYKNPTKTFENVWYAGETERKLLTGKNYGESNRQFLTFDSFKKSITGGLGAYTTRIGPEYGMAQVLTKYSTAEHPTMIFKVAAGGTSLRDSKDELSKEYGNWYPRSLWESKHGADYVPDIVNDSTSNIATGILYQLFVSDFKQVYNELIENGYTPVIKGMAWMQGETDLNRANDVYDSLLKTFIKDLRKDLVKITNDDNVNNMPFVIGEIATSFSKYNNPDVTPMIKMQRKVAKDMGSSVETIQTKDLIIVKKDGTSNGPDNFHFQFKDAVTLGNRFANKLLELQNDVRVYTEIENGNLNWNIADNNEITINISPDKHFKVESACLNNIDITSLVVDNVLKTKITEKENRFYIKCVEKQKFNIEYQENENAGFLFAQKIGYENETIQLKVYEKSGCKIEKVTFNDVELTFNSQANCYEFVPTTDGIVKIQTSADHNDNGDGSGSGGGQATTGCGSNVAGNSSSSLLLFLTITAMTIFIIRKKTKR